MPQVRMNMATCWIMSRLVFDTGITVSRDILTISTLLCWSMSTTECLPIKLKELIAKESKKATIEMQKEIDRLKSIIGQTNNTRYKKERERDNVTSPLHGKL